MNDEPKLKPPYVAYATFKNFISSMEELVPARIDATHPFMVGQSGSTQSYLMSALRFFELVDDRTPTPALQTFVKSKDEERKEMWRKMFTKAYSPIMSDLDLTTATAGMLHEKFREQSLSGETINKCYSFFIAGAEDAGLPMAPHLRPGARGSGGNAPRRSRKVPRSNGGQQEPASNESKTDTEKPPAEHVTATLRLNADGSRIVKLITPPTITASELERIKNWMGFQLIVDAPK